jgi:hypothetical protein
MPDFLPDQPELQALAQLSGVAPSKMAAAFDDIEHFSNHMTQEDIDRLRDAIERLSSLLRQFMARVEPRES